MSERRVVTYAQAGQKVRPGPSMSWSGPRSLPSGQDLQRSGKSAPTRYCPYRLLRHASGGSLAATASAGLGDLDRALLEFPPGVQICCSCCATLADPLARPTVLVAVVATSRGAECFVRPFWVAPSESPSASAPVRCRGISSPPRRGRQEVGGEFQHQFSSPRRVAWTHVAGNSGRGGITPDDTDAGTASACVPAPQECDRGNAWI